MSGRAETASPAASPGVWHMYRAMVGVGLVCGLLIVVVFELTRPVIDRNKAEADVQVKDGWQNELRSMLGLAQQGTDVKADSDVWLHQQRRIAARQSATDQHAPADDDDATPAELTELNPRDWLDFFGIPEE